MEQPQSLETGSGNTPNTPTTYKEMLPLIRAFNKMQTFKENQVNSKTSRAKDQIRAIRKTKDMS